MRCFHRNPCNLKGQGSRLKNYCRFLSSPGCCGSSSHRTAAGQPSRPTLQPTQLHCRQCRHVVTTCCTVSAMRASTPKSGPMPACKSVSKATRHLQGGEDVPPQRVEIAFSIHCWRNVARIGEVHYRAILAVQDIQVVRVVQPVDRACRHRRAASAAVQLLMSSRANELVRRNTASTQLHSICLCVLSAEPRPKRKTRTGHS